MNSFDDNIKDKLTGHEMALPTGLWDKIHDELHPPKRRILPLWGWTGLSLFMIAILGYFVLWPNTNEIATTKTSANEYEAINTSLEKPLPNENVPIIPTNISEEKEEVVPITKVKNHHKKTAINKVKSAQETSKNLSAQRESKPVYMSSEVSMQSKELSRSNPKAETFESVRSFNNEAVENIVGLTTQLENEPLFLLKNFHTKPGCYSFGREAVSTVFSVDIYGGPLMAMNNFEKATNSQDIDGAYLKIRKEEKELMGYTAGVRLSVLFNDKIGVRAGVNFSHNEERFSYLDPNVFQTTVITITMDTIWNTPGGPPIIINDTISVTTTGQREVKHHNKYNYLDIPVMMTFEKSLSDKWTLNFNGGAMINVKSSAKGKMSNLSKNIIDFDNTDVNNEDIFKTSVGLSLIGSVGLNYKLNNHLQILFEPQFRKILKPITLDSHPLRQNQSHLSFVTGVRYTF